MSFQFLYPNVFSFFIFSKVLMTLLKLTSHCGWQGAMFISFYDIWIFKVFFPIDTKNGQTYFKKILHEHCKIFKVCLAIFNVMHDRFKRILKDSLLFPVYWTLWKLHYNKKIIRYSYNWYCQRCEIPTFSVYFGELKCWWPMLIINSS